MNQIKKLMQFAALFSYFYVATMLPAVPRVFVNNMSMIDTTVSKDIFFNSAFSSLSPEVQLELQEYLASLSSEATLYMMFVAADNNLRPWIIKNLEQTLQQGSNQNLIILVHLDIKLKNNEKVTRRYLMLKNKMIHLNADDVHSQKMDSGDPKTLISFCKFALENFKAKNNVLVMWDHGSGACASGNYYNFRSDERFKYNQETKLYEVDRSSSFMDLVNSQEEEPSRGICWDDTTGHYLSMKDLDYALGKIVEFLPASSQKKLDAIYFDACLMQMIEVASVVKRYAKLMVGSQEAILALGFEYAKTLGIFHRDKPVSHIDLALHTVKEYDHFYSKITRDYQLSAIDLSLVDALEENVNEVALLLKKCLMKDANQAVKKALYASKSSAFCTFFAARSYIDLDHFYRNVLSNLHLFKLTDANEQKTIVNQLKNSISHGRLLLKNAVIANMVGKNLSEARGISIYFPERLVHSSYSRTPIAQSNAWPSFLAQYHQK